MSPFGFGFDFMFTLVPLFMMICFVIVIGGIIINSVKGIKQWNKNNQSPVLTVEAEIVAKRMAIERSQHHQAGDHTHHHTSTYTTYFVTFEFESGDRLELVVPDKEYGVLVEGDEGKLTFQGTRYKEFVRNKE